MCVFQLEMAETTVQSVSVLVHKIICLYIATHLVSSIWTLTQLSSVVKVACISLDEGMQGSDSGCSTSSILLVICDGPTLL